MALGNASVANEAGSLAFGDGASAAAGATNGVHSALARRLPRPLFAPLRPYNSNAVLVTGPKVSELPGLTRASLFTSATRPGLPRSLTMAV